MWTQMEFVRGVFVLILCQRWCFFGGCEGVSNFGSDSLKDALCDLQRVKYFQSYLKNLLKAIK